MKNLVLLTVLVLGACTSAIKDDKTEKEDPEKKEAVEVVEEFRPEPTKNLVIHAKEDLIGYWVGWFEPDLTDSEKEKLREQNYYPSHNKINISIDRFENDSVFGHSVVANNNRPFAGTVISSSIFYKFDVLEPGDDKHDGHFKFQIGKRDSFIRGYWTAYDTALKVYKRGYKLSKKVFKYNPENRLEDWFVDEDKHPERDSIDLVNLLEGRSWEEVLKSYNLRSDTDLEAMSQEDKLEELEQILAEINETEYEFYMTTDFSVDINPSTDTLAGSLVAEMSKADIYVLRNSIFARHGYSFKKKDLRAYFDRMSWYIPVHANIRSDITELEKQNIKLLLAYEEHAEEYYDEFGR
jgi:hypothetical protein